MRHGIATVVACGAAAAAWGLGGAAGAAPRADQVKSHGAAMEVLEVLAQDLLPPAEALAKAARDAGQAIPCEIELMAAKKGEKRVVAWEIDYVDGEKMLEVKVDARTGEVLSRESEDDPAEVKAQKARLAAGKTGLAEALAAAGPGLVLSAGLDGKGEATAWETCLVRSGKAAEVRVHVGTGKVVAGGGGDDDEDDDDGEDEDDDEGEDDDDDDK